MVVVVMEDVTANTSKKEAALEKEGIILSCGEEFYVLGKKKKSISGMLKKKEKKKYMSIIRVQNEDAKERERERDYHGKGQDLDVACLILCLLSL